VSGARLEVVSGGQTGVDRAALDTALALGLPCGGWCPRGRRAEDGAVPDRYPLRETPSAAYPERTEWNVRDSDGTLVLHRGRLRGGTALTLRLARRYRRPAVAVDLAATPAAAPVRRWLERERIGRLNVAGPRESEQPGIHDQAAAFLREVFARPEEAPSG
jgi:putative molybdenum carrier protein